jgi:MFS family permease
MSHNLGETNSESMAVTGRRDFSHAWRALRHRNFRLFFAGQSISLVGTWMTRVAISWLVYRLTKSALLLGMVGFAGQIPAFLLAPLGGVIVDRFDRHKLLIWTQVLAMFQSLMLAVLTLTHIINIHEILALSVLQGIINALDMPARQSFMVKMVEDKADLSNAIAINSSMANTARLVGPALAGILIAATNEGWCFLVDGVSYVAVVISLLMMRIASTREASAGAGVLEQLREGWSYVTGFVPIRTILLLFALLSLMGWPFMVLMPLFAAQVLHGGPHTMGFLMGAVGVGALACALSMAMRRTVRGLVRMLPIAASIFGVGLILFGLSRWLWLSMLLMLFTGFGMMQGLTGSNTILQTLVDEKMRGRVMSYHAMAFVGMAPFGSLLSGALAHAIGAPHTVIISGVACIAGALWFTTRLKALRVELRPIYERMGIVPQAGIVDDEGAQGT